MDISEYKKIIQNAIVNEVEAEAFYESASKKIKNEHLKEMFNLLASEEKKHQEILKRIQESNQISEYFNEAIDYKVAETVPTPVLSTDMTPADAFALAMKKEQEAMEYYTKIAAHCENVEKKKVFLDLAAMEQNHKLKMEKAFVDIGYPEVW
jgi:rubrerythrin